MITRGKVKAESKAKSKDRLIGSIEAGHDKEISVIVQSYKDREYLLGPLARHQVLYPTRRIS